MLNIPEIEAPLKKIQKFFFIHDHDTEKILFIGIDLFFIIIKRRYLKIVLFTVDVTTP